MARFPDSCKMPVIHREARFVILRWGIGKCQTMKKVLKTVVDRLDFQYHHQMQINKEFCIYFVLNNLSYIILQSLRTSLYSI